MRFPLVLFSLLPLLLCSCPEEEKERERERRADEETSGCRSCPMISILSDENCLVGYECNADWKLTSNVLDPNECACSELRCADRNATLAVNGDRVGKIRCNANEWTLPDDPTTPATSAVCAKSCGRRVCKPKPPKINDPTPYSELVVKDPSAAEYCASAVCPKGIAVIDENGEVKGKHADITSLVCASSGKWKIDGVEEQYAMCLGCGKGVCEPKNPHVSVPYYSALPVTDPTDPSGCASAVCPNGFAIFEDNGVLQMAITVPATLECMIDGEWTIPGYFTAKYFMCIECMCTDSKLTDGIRGACPPNRLCTLPMPKEEDKCELQCPENSNLRYMDTDGFNGQPDSIRCAGSEWRASDITDITCEYEDGFGHSSNPSGACSPLLELDCPSAGDCTPAELVYTPIDDGYRVLCKSGVLVTDKTSTGEVMVADCTAGSWTYGGDIIASANCVTDGDVTMKACVDAVPGGKATITFTCLFGACTGKCVESNKDFQYDLPGGDKVLKAEYVKCLADKLHSVDLQEIQNVNCV